MGARLQCIELSASRQPADDRPLLTSGVFGVGTFSQLEIAEFSSPELARASGERASNRRADGTLWIVGERQRVSA